MARNQNGHSVLIELMVVILFFALSSVIILRLYTTAHISGNTSLVSTRVLLQAQNWSDMIYSAEDVPSLLLNDGWTANNSQLTLQVDGGLLVVSGMSEETGANGNLFSCEMSAYAGAERIFEYPIVRYMSNEAAQ
jgi:hypothetical protein